MNETKTTNDLLKQIQDAQPDTETRVVHAMTVGQWARQGDIYLVRVPETQPRGEACGRQLAVGTTQGSRHVAESPATCFLGTTAPAGTVDALLGPCIESTEAFRVSHPEHADVILPAGTYQVLHQMDMQTRLRVQD